MPAMRALALLVVVVVVVAVPALAQMPSAKPAPELDALARDMVGSWTCQNVLKMGKTEQRYASKITWTRDLGGFWLTGRSEADAGGLKIEAVVHFGYDPRTKTWIEVGFDNRGGWVNLSGRGTPDRIELGGKGSGMGQEMTLQMTMTRRSDTEVAVVSSVAGGGQSFSEETICRK